MPSDDEEEDDEAIYSSESEDESTGYRRQSNKIKRITTPQVINKLKSNIPLPSDEEGKEFFY